MASKKTNKKAPQAKPALKLTDSERGTIRRLKLIVPVNETHAAKLRGMIAAVEREAAARG